MRRWIVLVLFFSMSACGAAQKKEEKAKKQIEFHYKMGAGYFQSREIPLAIKELTHTLELDPEHYEAHHLLGFIYMGRRDYAKAMKHFNETLRIKPDYHIARNNLGTLYLAMERWRDASSEFEVLIEEPLYPTPELAHNNLGWARYNLRKYKDALESFRMATFLKPEMCLAHNNMGLTFEKLGNTSEAVRSYEEAIRLCPNNYAEPHLHVGKIKQEAGDPNAVNHFRRCVELERTSNLGRRCREYLGIH